MVIPLKFKNSSNTDVLTLRFIGYGHYSLMILKVNKEKIFYVFEGSGKMCTAAVLRQC